MAFKSLNYAVRLFSSFFLLQILARSIALTAHYKYKLNYTDTNQRVYFIYFTRMTDVPFDEMNGNRRSVQRFEFRPVISAAPIYKIEGHIAASD